jgi:hypothetical protein
MYSLIQHLQTLHFARAVYLKFSYDYQNKYKTISLNTIHQLVFVMETLCFHVL